MAPKVRFDYIQVAKMQARLGTAARRVSLAAVEIAAGFPTALTPLKNPIAGTRINLGFDTRDTNRWCGGRVLSCLVSGSSELAFVGHLACFDAMRAVPPSQPWAKVCREDCQRKLDRVLSPASLASVAFLRVWDLVP